MNQVLVQGAYDAAASTNGHPGTEARVWAARIAECWRSGVEAYFRAGHLLNEAKASLPRGAWGDMMEALPFGERHAQMLMAIAADPRLSNPQYIALLPPSWGTIYDLTRLDDGELERGFREHIIRPDMERRDVDLIRPARIPTSPRIAQPMSDAEVFAGDVEQAARDNSTGPTWQPPSGEIPGPGTNSPLPNGARAIMGSRQEADDSLDFFPTPPWATRALLEHVFPHLERRGHCKWQNAWEPACGEGHIAEVLQEYFLRVIASDIHDYGYPETKTADFLKGAPLRNADWVITNPPFGDAGESFVRNALDIAGTGVAMFMRVQWLDSIGRYERIFRDKPPTLIAFFAERVPLCKGRWDPDGSTATAYMWLVWLKGAEPRAPFWIPPGCREALTRPDDVDRFTVHPVIRRHKPLNKDETA